MMVRDLRNVSCMAFDARPTPAGAIDRKQRQNARLTPNDPPPMSPRWGSVPSGVGLFCLPPSPTAQRQSPWASRHRPLCGLRIVASLFSSLVTRHLSLLLGQNLKIHVAGQRAARGHHLDGSGGGAGRDDGLDPGRRFDRKGRGRAIEAYAAGPVEVIAKNEGALPHYP
jgi:hypothetical protein